jgi:phage-related protein
VNVAKDQGCYLLRRKWSGPSIDLDALPAKVQGKCTVKIERLRDLGHELRRPKADCLREGIYEFQASYQSVNYRILYFFHGKIAAVLSHGLTKEGVVPPAEIDRALGRKRKFELDAKRPTLEER